MVSIQKVSLIYLLSHPTNFIFDIRQKSSKYLIFDKIYQQLSGGITLIVSYVYPKVDQAENCAYIFRRCAMYIVLMACMENFSPFISRNFSLVLCSHYCKLSCTVTMYSQRIGTTNKTVAAESATVPTITNTNKRIHIKLKLAIADVATVFCVC